MLVLPRQLANILAVGTLGVLYFEYRLDETQRIPALAHWLVYLQLIKYFLPKTAEDDWFLFLLGLMQVLIGSVVNQSDQVGTWLFLWAMLAVWVLGQFFLQREALRFSGEVASQAVRLWQPARREFHAPSVDPYRGLFDFPYVAATVQGHGHHARPGRTDLSRACPARPARLGPSPAPRSPGISRVSTRKCSSASLARSSKTTRSS